MKKIVYKFAFLLAGLFIISSCQENELPIFDTENGRAIAGFNGNTETPRIIFNPAADTENTLTIGVSTLSPSDRSVTLELDSEATTLDPSFFSISTLNPVIPAGAFTVDITVTTFGSQNLPGTDDVIALNLISVEGAEILTESESNLSIGIDVRCPSVDFASIPGTYRILVDGFDTSVGDDLFEIVAGPGENQVTFVNPFDHPNPDAGGAQNFDIVVDISISSGSVSIDRQPAWHCDNFGCGFGQGRINGNGLVLTCINQFQLILTHTVDAGSFGSFDFVIEKQ